jgi:predicted AlkP superfamily pyrophosphatase or phosphodiesterase
LLPNCQQRRPACGERFWQVVGVSKDRPLAALLSSIAAELGVAGFSDELGLHLDAPRVCVLLVDGLGLLQLRARAEVAPFLSSLLQAPETSYLCAGFPSTTATSLTSLGTGLFVGRHGVVGYTAAVPGENRLVNLLRWDNVDPLAWQPYETVSARAARAGLPVTAVSSPVFEKSGLTVASLRGATWAGAESVGERVATAAAALRHRRRALVYVYYSDLDSTGHHRGWTSDAWSYELAHVDRFVEQLASALPRDGVLLVTADHGMVDVGPQGRVDFDTDSALQQGVALIAGDPRARYVYARPGAAADVLAAWREKLGSRAEVISRAEAADAGWFGPDVSHDVLPRIGDVIAVSGHDTAVVATRREPSESKIIGMHGGLTEDEVLVPLALARPG